MVRLAIENAMEDKEWSSTDLVQYLKHQYENEKTVQKQWNGSDNWISSKLLKGLVYFVHAVVHSINKNVCRQGFKHSEVHDLVFCIILLFFYWYITASYLTVRNGSSSGSIRNCIFVSHKLLALKGDSRGEIKFTAVGWKTSQHLIRKLFLSGFANVWFSEYFSH